MIRRTLALGMALMAVGASPALAQDPTSAGYGETPVPPITQVVPTPDPQGGVAPGRVSGGMKDSSTPGQPAGNAPAAGKPTRNSGVAGARASGAAPSAAAADTAPVTPVAASGDSLPFTGLDVGVIAMMALVLLAAGFGLRRAAGDAR